MSTRLTTGSTVSVEDSSGATVATGSIGQEHPTQGSPFPHQYPLDLGPIAAAGRYTVVVRGTVNARSPSFVVDTSSTLYRPLEQNALRFFAAQHDGTQVASGILGRQPSHLNDMRARVFRTPVLKKGQLTLPLVPLPGRPIDVSGGWFDAGDYLKFVETASFADVLLLAAARDAPPPDAAPIAAEARFGTDWLLKMWQPTSGALAYQVGIGDGVGDRVLGDHDLWRLPERDDHLPAGPNSPTRYVAHRPVFQETGAISPNIAGRLAAAFGLCSQVARASDPAYADRCLEAGMSVFARARRSSITSLTTTVPYAYYPEVSWRDDMTLGAVELARAVADRPGGRQRAAAYLAKARTWTRAQMAAPNQDNVDSFNLYEVRWLADYELGRTTGDATLKREVTEDLERRLNLASQLARGNAFGFANPAAPADPVAHALGYQLMAQWYEALSGSTRYRLVAARERDWVFGANPWGSSFVVGSGSRFPTCLHHQVANLSGSRNGTSPLLLGALVDGPNDPASIRGSLGVPDGAHRCPTSGGDLFGRFDSTGPFGTAYRDDVQSAQSSEPSIDINAMALAIFARAANQSG